MRNIALVLLASISLLGYGLQSANAGDAPKDNQGFTASKTTVVELGPEIEGMSGRQLRMRLLTIHPGGRIGMHNHKDRPAVVYDIQGTDTVTQADGSSRTLHPGDTSTATKDTAHWHRNDGKDDVLLIAVDVFHPAK